MTPLVEKLNEPLLFRMEMFAMFASVFHHRNVHLRGCLAALTLASHDRSAAWSASRFHLRTCSTTGSYNLFGIILLVFAAALGTSGMRQRAPTDIPRKNMMVHPAPSQSLHNMSRFKVFGPDDRFQVVNTHLLPWSAVALVRIYWSADDLVGMACTGWMVGPSVLATSAHCIYDHGYPHHVIIKPAMNTDAPDPTPFGTCAAVAAVVPDAWIQNTSMDYDYGVYRLDCAVGKQTGVLGFMATTGDWSQQPVQLTGYPGDKPGRTMWSGVGKVTSSSAKGMFYDVDMRRGQSGSPVWDTTDKDCYACVVAINSSEFAGPTMNYGVRIDLETFKILLEEMAFDPNQPTVSLHPPETKIDIHAFSAVDSNAN